MEKPSEQTEDQQKQKLIVLLQMAYSGEKSAAYAYQGHAAAVRCPKEKALIQKIEREEWEHREGVGQMLAFLGAGPNPARELLQVMIGRVLKAMCPFSGWFLPMYCAMKLEENNIEEYVRAAKYAHALNLPEMAKELMRMSVVEREHAEAFAKTVRGKHPNIYGLNVFLGFLDRLILLGKSR